MPMELWDLLSTILDLMKENQQKTTEINYLTIIKTYSLLAELPVVPSYKIRRFERSERCIGRRYTNQNSPISHTLERPYVHSLYSCVLRIICHCITLFE